MLLSQNVYKYLNTALAETGSGDPFGEDEDHLLPPLKLVAS
jgi:hypothetical protein